MNRHGIVRICLLIWLVLAGAAEPPRGWAQAPQDIEAMQKFFREQRQRREAALEQRIREHPEDVEAYLELGKLYGIDKRVEEAIRAYAQAANLDPQNDIAHFNLGLLYHRDGRLEEAIQAFRKVLEITPRDLPSRINLTLVYRDVRGELLEKEIAVLEEAVRIRPSYLEARYHLGIAYKTRGDHSAACGPWYEKAHSELTQYVVGNPAGQQVDRANRQMRLLETLVRECLPGR